ncbi:MAG: EAL domain-containing response regulator [Proteobacteria bacterium]|nr:EAL domain-containing response regulator [Pseudomonadota bacterium]
MARARLKKPRSADGRPPAVDVQERSLRPIAGIYLPGKTYVFEDHDLVLSLLSSWLSLRGHRVVPCQPSNLNALRSIGSHDLVILDLCLEDRDGIDVLEYLAKIGFLGDVVLISAFPESVVEAASKIGTDLGLNIIGALRKPLVFDRLESLLSSRRPRGAIFPLVRREAVTLNQALAAGKVTFHFQPILDVRSEQVVSLELLARLIDSSGSELSAISAIETAEAEDLRGLACVAIDAIDGLNSKLLERGIGPLPVAINVPSSLVQRRHFGSILSRIKDAATPITFEVSELDSFEDLSDARRVTTSSVLQGLRFSLDDFGTVYSNIDRFVQLPFDELKLDRVYVAGCAHDRFRSAVCRCAIELAHMRGAIVVAEGVEEAADLEHLRSLGADRVQGYLFSRPLTASAIADWLAERRETSVTDMNPGKDDQ